MVAFRLCFLTNPEIGWEEYSADIKNQLLYEQCIFLDITTSTV